MDISSDKQVKSYLRKRGQGFPEKEILRETDSLLIAVQNNT